LVVTLSATATDSDGSIELYEWDFDGNGTYDASTATTPVSYTFTSAGTYTAMVRVTDDQGGTATGQTTITVTNDGAEVGQGGGAKSGSGGGCFIASAAFGSYLEPHVEVLRDFRDNYLLTNGPGTAFVKLYYEISPPIADYISRHDGVKLVIRILLTPVVYAVKYSLLSLAAVGFVTIAGVMLHLRVGRSSKLA
jgi:PKD repeat protein